MADLCILYEVTGYQDESAEVGFWESYKDFFELGDVGETNRQTIFQSYDPEEESMSQMLDRIRQQRQSSQRKRPTITESDD